MSQAISSLANGAKIKLGSIYGTPIQWVVADKNHSGYPSNSVTLVTAQIIKMMCFDAKEPTNGDPARAGYGNNRYIYSNIRQWLNSNAAAGAWYSAQHAADASPASTNVYDGYNAYDTVAGFLNAFSANEQAALLNTTHTICKSTTDGGGTEDCVDKVFLLTCTEVNLYGGTTAGAKIAIFSDNASRVATVTSECVSNSNYIDDPTSGTAWFWWLADAYASSTENTCMVRQDGALEFLVDCYGYCGLRPACNISSSTLVSDTTDVDGCYTAILNQSPSAPPSISVSSPVLSTATHTVTWTASTDADGNLSGYVLERKNDSGAWAAIYDGPLLTYNQPTGSYTTIQYRVKAYDSAGAESDYTTSSAVTVIYNAAPVISGSDASLGTKSAGFSQTYSVTDANSDSVTVVEKIDGSTVRTYTASLGATNTFSVTGNTWLALANGSHTMVVTATDPYYTSTRTYTFTKTITSCSVQSPVYASATKPVRCIASVNYTASAGAVLLVQACNNANDASPTWENITSIIGTTSAFTFTNTTKTAANWGFAIKVTLSRNGTSGACYISSVSGNFE